MQYEVPYAKLPTLMFEIRDGYQSYDIDRTKMDLYVENGAVTFNREKMVPEIESTRYEVRKCTEDDFETDYEKREYN